MQERHHCLTYQRNVMGTLVRYRKHQSFPRSAALEVIYSLFNAFDVAFNIVLNI